MGATIFSVVESDNTLTVIYHPLKLDLGAKTNIFWVDEAYQSAEFIILLLLYNPFMQRAPLALGGSFVSQLESFARKTPGNKPVFGGCFYLVHILVHTCLALRSGDKPRMIW